MRVLIRTLTPRSANYGGVLQSWALQRVLSAHDFEPRTDFSVRQQNPISSTSKGAILAVRGWFPADRDLIPGDRERRSNSQVLDFVDREIKGVDLYPRWSTRPRSGIVSSADAFVVGSDQIWRQQYADVYSYMLDFLDPQDTRPRIAYAASLGAVSANKWTSDQIATIQELLSRFDSVSFREESGVKWCQEEIGISASLMPDPTLLLLPSDYDRLISTAVLEEQNREPYLVQYLLDPSQETRQAVLGVANRLGLQLKVINGSGSGDGLRVSIPEWLATLRGAQGVVTDSFHGMVFSTIFTRPVAVLTNAARGIDRFESFASRYGLANNIVAFEDQHNSERIELALGLAINNSTFAADRDAGLAFLLEGLASNKNEMHAKD